MKTASRFCSSKTTRNDVKLAMHAFKAHHLANQVHVVRDGAEALEFIFCTDRYGAARSRTSPKLILLDLKLPLVDGIEVLAHQGRRRARAIPVVVLTSSQERPRHRGELQLGVNSYIVKPVDFDQFTDAVQQLGYYWLLLNQPPVPAL